MPVWLFGLLRNKLVRQIGLALGSFLALATFGKINRKLGKNEGEAEELARQKGLDHENAIDIRDRVDAVEDVRDDITGKFRD